MNRFGFVLRQIRARPVRTLTTSLAFAISVGLLGFLFLLNSALQQEWSPYMGQRAMLLGKTSFFEELPMSYLSKIEAIEGVERVAPFDFVIAFHRNNRPENQVPVSAAPGPELLHVYKEAQVPPDQAKAWLADPTGALIGPILVRKFGWKPGDRIVLQAPVRGGVIETTVRAVMGYNLEGGVYIHRKYFENLSGREGKAAMFWILARNRDDLAGITATLNKTFENAPVPVLAMTEKQWQLQFLQMLGNVKLLIGSLGLATAFSLLLITSNSLAMSARERRGESALLRILGFSRGEVAAFLVGEALVYGTLGALAGTGLMAGFAHFVGMALDNTQYAGISGLLQPTAPTVVVSIGSAAVLAVISAVVPAAGLSRRPIVELLRQAG
jgi:putative ABC transport system permease protein